jgi:hypothetical protein
MIRDLSRAIEDLYTRAGIVKRASCLGFLVHRACDIFPRERGFATRQPDMRRGRRFLRTLAHSSGIGFGGATTADNLELLCWDYNQKKKATLSVPSGKIHGE